MILQENAPMYIQLMKKWNNLQSNGMKNQWLITWTQKGLFKTALAYYSKQIACINN